MAEPRFELGVLELLEPNRMLVVWGDGHESLYPYVTLRRACPCARCVDEWTGKQLLDAGRVPPNIKVLGWSRTGHYGVSLRFSDGHATGIYTLERLRALCPCPECQTRVS